MADYLPIRLLIWDEWNLEHITKHSVLRSEIEELIYGEGELVIIETYKGRLQLLGQASSGSVLSVIVGPDRLRDAGTFYVFSARRASRKERQSYAEVQKGLHS